MMNSETTRTCLREVIFSCLDSYCIYVNMKENYEKTVLSLKNIY